MNKAGKPKVGIGIITYNRPAYFKQCVEAVKKNVKSAEFVVVYNDGSQPIYQSQYQSTYDHLPKDWRIIHAAKNTGVARGKNILLQTMLDAGCKHLFLLEDDIIITNDLAVNGYINAAKKTGFGHLMFAHHGPMNAPGPLYKDDFIEYYPHCIGAWCYYSREALERLAKEDEKKGWPNPGLMDENFKNAWEHVEHTNRLGNLGLTSPFGFFADARGSDKWLKEIPGSIDQSAIRPQADWQKRIDEGYDYWKAKDGRGLPLQDADIRRAQ